MSRIAFGLYDSSRHQRLKPIIGAEGYPLLGSAALLAGSQPLEIQPTTGDRAAANRKVHDGIERGFGLLLQRHERNASEHGVWGMERVRARALLRHSARVLTDATCTARARRMWGAVGEERARLASVPTTAAVEGIGMMQADEETRAGLMAVEAGAVVDGRNGNEDADDADDEDSDEVEDDEEEEDDDEDHWQRASDDWDFGSDEEDTEVIH